jgi:hypothetical protein
MYAPRACAFVYLSKDHLQTVWEHLLTSRYTVDGIFNIVRARGLRSVQVRGASVFAFTHHFIHLTDSRKLFRQIIS